MRIRIGKTEITVTFAFAAILALMLATDRTGLIIPTALAVFIHEAAHLLTMSVFGCAPLEIILTPGSIQIIKNGINSLKNENKILIAGPLSNIIFFIIFYLVFYATESKQVLQFAAVELIIGLFNLLPAKGLDGGALVYNFALKIKNTYFAELVLNVTTLTTVVCLIFLGVTLFLRGQGNISIFLIALYILIFSIIKN